MDRMIGSLVITFEVVVDWERFLRKYARLCGSIGRFCCFVLTYRLDAISGSSRIQKMLL
jgi:hypothetical protein